MKKQRKEIDFIGHSKVYYIVSCSLIVLGLIFALIFGIEVDIQFRGGTMLNYAYSGDLDTAAFQKSAETLLNQKVTTTEGVDFSTGNKTIKIYLTDNSGLTSDRQFEITSSLQEQYAANAVDLVESSDVSPSSGKEFFYKCLVAVAFSFLMLVIYIALRFKNIGGLSAGNMAIVALVHDVFMVFATFVIFSIPINANFMAVVLTILGYSVNDTIVIYDRIRENKKIYGNKLNTRDLVNKSINQSFTRSLNTSISTIITMIVVTVVAAIYRVDSIISFSFPLIIGMISGVYSTLCIAVPLWVHWKEHVEKKEAYAAEVAAKSGKPVKAVEKIVEEETEEYEEESESDE